VPPPAVYDTYDRQTYVAAPDYPAYTPSQFVAAPAATDYSDYAYSNLEPEPDTDIEDPFGFDARKKEIRGRKTDQFLSMDLRLLAGYREDDFDWNHFYYEHKIPALTFSYNPNLQKFFLLSDLIICRAGAGTMFEIEFFNKKCLVIPLVAASTGHQVLNAYAMQRRHPSLFTVLEQLEAQQAPEKFNTLVLRLLGI